MVVQHHDGKDFYALPGGHLEWGEDPKTCIVREVIEELGVEPKVGDLLYVNTFSGGETQYVEFFFEILNPADFLDLGGRPRSHAFELKDIAWVGPDDLRTIKPKILEDDFRAGRLVGHGVKFYSTE